MGQRYRDTDGERAELLSLFDRMSPEGRQFVLLAAVSAAYADAAGALETRNFLPGVGEGRAIELYAGQRPIPLRDQ